MHPRYACPSPGPREAEMKRREEGEDRTKRQMPRRKVRRLWRVCTHTWRDAKEENMLKGTAGCLPLLPHTPRHRLIFSGLIG